MKNVCGDHSNDNDTENANDINGNISADHVSALRAATHNLGSDIAISRSAAFCNISSSAPRLSEQREGWACRPTLTSA